MDHEMLNKRVKVLTVGKYGARTGTIKSVHEAGLYEPKAETFLVKFDDVSEGGLFRADELEVIEETDGEQKPID